MIHVYVGEYGAYLNELSRGSLTFPGDGVCQWVIYSYILLDEINSSICRKRLCNERRRFKQELPYTNKNFLYKNSLNVLMIITDFYGIQNIEKQHSRNILVKNYCHLYSPRSSKKSKLKLLKLSNS